MGKSKPLPGTEETTEADKAIPKSIIIYRGAVGPNLRALVQDWREVFLPWSSKRLRGENRSLKDFLSVASLLSVSHLQLITSPPGGAVLRVMRFANGPTLSFRLLSFSLRREVRAGQRRPPSFDTALWDAAPVVVLNNFTHPEAAGRAEVPLLEATLRGMFPPTDVPHTRGAEVRRVCLFHYDTAAHAVEVRHYAIRTNAAGASREVRRLLQRRHQTRWGRYASVDALLERDETASDTDGDGAEVPRWTAAATHPERCRVKLIEIGPRLTLQLVKVTNGFADGEVLFHRHETKSREEVMRSSAKVRARRTEKAKRKAEQDANVRRKGEVREERRAHKRQRREAAMKSQREDPLEVVHGATYEEEEE